MTSFKVAGVQRRWFFGAAAAVVITSLGCDASPGATTRDGGRAAAMDTGSSIPGTDSGVSQTGRDGGTTVSDGGFVVTQPDAGMMGTVDGGSTAPDGGSLSGPITADGGTVDLLHFAAFGDVRPPLPEDTIGYPTATVRQVFQGIQGTGAPFALGTGDYMFALTSGGASAQIDLFVQAEAMYTGYVFHAMGNHECNGLTDSNCPNLNETGNIQVFRSRLQADLPNVYHDFTVATSLGDAHFILVAPNAWNLAQQAWLATALAAPARYRFVVMHEPPGIVGTPAGATIAEGLIDAQSDVTLRIYGHTHLYSHTDPNIVITGNGGAPLDATNAYFGFIEVQQRPNGDIEVNAYEVGSPAMLVSAFVVTPAGVLTP